MVDSVPFDLQQQNMSRFEVKNGRYFLDDVEVSAHEAVNLLVTSLQTLGDMVQNQSGIVEKNQYADRRLIEWLLHRSGVTCYQISKKSKVAESTLSRITSGETSMQAIRYGTAIKLSDYARELHDERMVPGKVIFEKGRDLQ